MPNNNSSWSEVQLGKLLTYINPIVELNDEVEYTTITVKRRHGGLEAREKLSGSQIRTKKQYKLVPEAFIISRVQCWHQAYAIIPKTIDQNMIASINYDQFIMSSEIDKHFFWWLSYSPRFTEIVRSCAFGVVIEKMVFNRNAWLSKTIALPPLEEQRRIVARIEEIVGKIEEARGLHHSSNEAISSLKASYMNALFDRSKHCNWPHFKLGEIADIRAGVTLGRTLNRPTISVPYLRVANVQDGHLDLDFIKEVDIYIEELEKWKLEYGDILLTEGGDWDKLGRGTIWKEEIPNCIHQNHIFRVRVTEKDFDVNFLAAYISSPYGKAYFQNAAKKTTNLATINQMQLRAFNVVKPPLEVQKEMVDLFNTLQSKIETLKQRQTQAAAELDALLPSILDKAFKGEL